MNILGMKEMVNRKAAVALAMAACSCLLFSVVAEGALHGTAGNTIIRNTATADFSDALGNVQTPASSTLDITVNTVAATPMVFSFSPASGNTDGTGSTAAYAVRIITNSNGPGAITFATADGAFTNVAAGTAPTVPAGTFLGATIIDPSDAKIGSAQTVNAGASLIFAVPNDGGTATDAATGGGASGDGIVNGIRSGDIVYLYDGGAHYYGPFTVGTVTDPAIGSGTTPAAGSVQLTNGTASAIGPFTPGYGWQIVEARDVTVTVTQGVVTDATLAASWVTTVTATMAGAPDGTGAVTTNAHMGALSVRKGVRNVTNNARNAAGLSAIGPVAINGGSYTYYMSGIVGKPGEVLEYVVAIRNVGTGASTSALSFDFVPYYTTLVAGATYGTSGGGSIFAHAKLGATETDMQIDGTLGNAAVAYGASTGTVGGSNISFSLGNGSSALAGGTIASGQTVHLIYRVTIN